MRYRRFAVLVLGVLAFAVAGCGGDDSTSSSSDDTTVEETTATEDTTADEMTEEETTASESTTDDIDLGDLSGECLEFAGVGAKIAEAMGASGASGDLTKTAELFDELVASAPDEIKADLETISGGITAMAEALQGTDLSSGATPDAETLAKLQQVMGSIDSEEMQAASTRIEAWAQENCTDK